MEHLLEGILLLENIPLLRGYIFCVVLGGLTPVVFIPLHEKYVVKSKHHIAVGDHEDIEKDLKNH